MNITVLQIPIFNIGGVIGLSTFESYDFDIIRIIKLLLRRFWVLLLCGILVCGMAFSYAYFLIAPTYASSIMVYVNNRSTSIGNMVAGISSSDLNVSQSLVKTYIVILGSRSTLNQVIEKSGVDCSYEKLSGMISAESVNSTEVFRITVTSENAETSKLLANTIAEVLPKVISDIVSGTSVRIVDNAVLSNKKTSPSYVLFAAVGFIIGVLIGCAIVIWRDINDDIIHGEDYLIQNYQVPLLAVIPNLSAESGSSYSYRYMSNPNE